MTTEVLKQMNEITCEICDWTAKMASVALLSCIAFTETAGRAKAASALSRMGYYEEAKALMTEKEKL
tara:strand:+ start:648 stop:848 length:201 start_codon:yes stop_codon:yes gene_type:complete